MVTRTTPPPAAPATIAVGGGGGGGGTGTGGTYFGEPLSAEARRLVDEVRQRVSQPLHERFNTDFNVFRFVMNAERAASGAKERESAAIVASAAKTLDQHLRVRKCLQLVRVELPLDAIAKKKKAKNRKKREETKAEIFFMPKKYSTNSLENFAARRNRKQPMMEGN